MLTIRSEKAYKAQLNTWNMRKNNSRNDWLAFARLYQDAGRASEVYILMYHKVRRIQDLRRYLKSHGEEENTFLAEAKLSVAPIPTDFCFCNRDGTIAPGMTPSSPQVARRLNLGQEIISQTPTTYQQPPWSGTGIISPGVLEPGSLQRFTTTRNGPQSARWGSVTPEDELSAKHERPQGQLRFPQLNSTGVMKSQDISLVDTNSLSDNADFSSDNADLPSDNADFPVDQAGSLFPLDSQESSVSFGHLSRYNSFQYVLADDASGMRENLGETPPFLMAPTNTLDNAMTTPLLDSQSHRPVSIINDAENTYTSACMMAGMLGAAQRRVNMTDCLERASQAYHQMCRFQSRAILTAAVSVLAWLLVHTEGDLSETIMTASFVAATEALGPSNAVCVLLEWMATCAKRDKIWKCRVGSAELREVWYGFRQTLGDNNAHTIVALYCLSFHLIRVDKNFVQAEEYLQYLSIVSAKAFGPCVLTLNILATLSRAQLRQKKYPLALETIVRSLDVAPLGLNHPHRLELLLRKALILRELDRWDETEQLYWIVARGRVATLGWQHKETVAAHNSLVWVLERNGTWEARKDDAHRLLADPQLTVSEHESWYRRLVEANRVTMDEDRESGDDD